MLLYKRDVLINIISSRTEVVLFIRRSYYNSGGTAAVVSTIVSKTPTKSTLECESKMQGPKRKTGRPAPHQRYDRGQHGQSAEPDEKKKAYFSELLRLNTVRAPNLVSKRPFLETTIGANKRPVRWLVDTGAAVSCMDSDDFEEVKKIADVEELQIPPWLKVEGATGDTFQLIGYFRLPLSVGQEERPHEVLVVKGLATRAILGMDFLQKYNATIDCQTRQVVFMPKVDSIRSREGDSNTTQPVVAAEVVLIPPRKARLLPCRSSGKGLGTVTSQHCVIDEILVNAEMGGRFPVLMFNATNQPVEWKRGMWVGQFEPTKEEELIPLDALTAKKRVPVALTDKKRAQIIEDLHFDLPVQQKKPFLELIFEFHDVVSDHPKDLGFTKAVEHVVRMKSPEPIYVKQFRVPDAHLDFLNEHVDALLQQGVIEVSASPFNTPIFCVKKPHGNGLRIVQDFRFINQASYDDHYDSKSIQQCIDTIGRKGSKIFSTIDLTSGFWQMALQDESKEVTAFSIPGRARYHWKRAPMGLKGSPSSFQRLMDLVMQDLGNTQCYIDDVLVHSPDIPQHLSHLRGCLERLREYNLKINLKKCAFGRQEVPYLGHVLTPEGVKPSMDKLKAVREFPEPSTVKKVREFCGLTNYFRNHIRGYALLSGRLTHLVKKSSEWKGGPLPLDAKIAFETLRDRLCTAPMLAYPARGRPFTLAVDAATGDDESPGGLGAILSQPDEKGEPRVVAYASRGLTDYEKNYTPFLLEKAAATWAIGKFHSYLWGTDKPFTLLTDHRPLEAMSKIHTKTLCRLKEQMNTGYNFVIVYRQGEKNGGPDALSRNPVDSIATSIADTVKLQTEDKDINMIKEYLEGQWLPAKKDDAQKVMTMAPHCMMEEGVVYFIMRKQGLRERQLLYVPHPLRERLVEGCHAHRLAGHVGTFKTVLRLQERYYWPGMTSEVTEYVKACRVCQRSKSHASQKTKVPLKPLEVLTEPGLRVHLDLFGPLRTSGQGKKHILVMTDAFSKYAECVAIPDKETKTVAQAFVDRWVCRFGTPRAIVTDRGREFNSELFDELCVLLKIDKRMTAALHPQSNSSAESWNRTLIKFLTAALDQNSTLDWEDQLPALMFSYNTSVHKSTLETPFYLTFLHPPNAPFYDADTPRPHYGESWPSEAYHRMTKAYQLARENNLAANAKMKEAHDRTQRVVEKDFHIGEEVLVHYPQTTLAQKYKSRVNRKFLQTWQDGYFVVARKGDQSDTYVVKKPHGQETIVNAERLKKVLTRKVTNQTNEEAKPLEPKPTETPAPPLNKKKKWQQPAAPSRHGMSTRNRPGATAEVAGLRVVCGDDQDSDDEEGCIELVFRARPAARPNDVPPARRIPPPAGGARAKTGGAATTSVLPVATLPLSVTDSTETSSSPMRGNVNRAGGRIRSIPETGQAGFRPPSTSTEDGEGHRKKKRPSTDDIGAAFGQTPTDDERLNEDHSSLPYEQDEFGLDDPFPTDSSQEQYDVLNRSVSEPNLSTQRRRGGENDPTRIRTGAGDPPPAESVWRMGMQAMANVLPGMGAPEVQKRQTRSRGDIVDPGYTPHIPPEYNKKTKTKKTQVNDEG